MTVFDAISAVGGLCLFLFGMKIMGESLERFAGYKLRLLIRKITENKLTGFLVGVVVTAILQSSSATTVMVVGFVSSGIMTLNQAVCVIIGANVGTTATAWLLSLNGISSTGISVLNFLKPEVFSPILGIIGIYFYMFSKKTEKKDLGAILLGFMALMLGMDVMTESLSLLTELPLFKNVLLALQNPFLGVVAGTLITALIQSSSAAIGILQAISASGGVAYATAVPFLMGSNIGTCITTIISSIGANTNAKRASCVHLIFNVLGSVIFMSFYCVGYYVIKLPIIQESVSLVGIAIVHTIFNVSASIIFVPLASVLERVATRLIREEKDETIVEFDERLYNTPAIALERAHTLANEMATITDELLRETLNTIDNKDISKVESLYQLEKKTDHYEDTLTKALVRISSLNISDYDSREIGKLLKSIGDFERIGDHCKNLCESIVELSKLESGLTDKATDELKVLTLAINDVFALTNHAFLRGDLASAYLVEPLEEVVDELTADLTSRHTHRLQKGKCRIETGTIWDELLTNLERISDHCSNIALSVIDASVDKMEAHKQLKSIKTGGHDFEKQFEIYHSQYMLPKE